MLAMLVSYLVNDNAIHKHLRLFGLLMHVGAPGKKSKTEAMYCPARELELELIQTQMAQKSMLRAEVGMRVRCANKASAE